MPSLSKKDAVHYVLQRPVRGPLGPGFVRTKYQSCILNLDFDCLSCLDADSGEHWLLAAPHASALTLPVRQKEFDNLIIDTQIALLRRMRPAVPTLRRHEPA